MRATSTLIVILGTALAASRSVAQQAPVFTVRVYDYVGAPDETLSKAQLAAQRIFRKAGIETEWTSCPKDVDAMDRYLACQKPATATDVILQVVPESMEGYEVSKTAFGFALPSSDAEPARHAYVFYGRAERAVRQSGKVSLVILLGYVIAHETGHLLLGPSMHSSRGIMRPRWQASEFREMERGTLAFPSAQARILRSRVQERAERALAGR